MEPIVKMFTTSDGTSQMAGDDAAPAVPREGLEGPLAPAPVLDEIRLARIAKALGHPERIRILTRLDDGRPHTVGEIVSGSSLAQSTISEHLGTLRRAGLLHADRDGPRTWYTVQRDLLRLFALEIERLSLMPQAAGKAPAPSP